MYTPSRRLIAATAALASALLLAGCASDDDPIATPSEPVATASASPSATPTIDDLCDAKVAIDAAFLAGGPPEEEEGATPSPEQIGEGISAAFSEPYAELKDAAAGSEVEAEVSTLVSGLESAIKEGNDEFFFEPDFVAADKTVDDLLVEECGFKKISGTAADYEFTGLPTISPEGLTALTLTNEGEEFHEIILMKIDDSLADTSLEAIFQMEEEELGDKVMPVGVVLAAPGVTATNFFDVEAGRYAVLCFISKDSTAENEFQGDGPPHFMEGMLEELKVIDPDAPAPTSSSSSDDSSSSGSSSTSEDEDEESTASPTSTSSS